MISIPTKVNGGGGNGELAEKQSYNFSVKDVQNDGIQEAVQQNRREMSMDSLGKIMLRMQIHANDDSYQNTRVKMDQAKQDLQKYNTKVIQQGDPNVGRKVKVKRPAGGGGTFPGNSKSLPNKPNFPGGSSAEFSNSSSASCANATFSSSSNLAPATTSSAASSSSLSSSTAAAASMYNKKSPSMPSSHLLTSMPRFGSKFTTNSAPAATGGGGSSSLNSNSSSSSNSLLAAAAAANNRQSTMSPPLPEATKRALRETIVHLLALRPMKLGELMGKAQEKVPGFSLTTPSSTSSTREQLLAVINAVASTKDSAVAGGTPLYHLKEGGWEELQLDWPHYSREDRELAMRRNPLMAANHVSPTTTSAQNNNGASNHHHSQHPPPPSTSSYNANYPHPKSSAVNGLSSSISPLSDGSSIRSMVHSTPSPTTSDICQPSPPPPSHPPSLLTTSHSSSGSSSHHHQLQLQHNKAKDFSPPLSNGSSSSSGSSGSDRPRHNSSNQQQQALKRVGSGVGNYDGRYSSNNNSNVINGLKKFKTTNSSSSSHYNNNNGSSISSKVGSDGMKSNGGPSHNGHNGHNNLNSSSNSQQQQHPYSKYTRIQSAEQLAAYRADFYAEFPEYRKQFEYVDGVSREFERLREVVLSKDEDSEEWQVRKGFERAVWTSFSNLLFV